MSIFLKQSRYTPLTFSARWRSALANRSKQDLPIVLSASLTSLSSKFASKLTRKRRRACLHLSFRRCQTCSGCTYCTCEVYASRSKICRPITLQHGFWCYDYSCLRGEGGLITLLSTPILYSSDANYLTISCLISILHVLYIL